MSDVEALVGAQPAKAPDPPGRPVGDHDIRLRRRRPRRPLLGGRGCAGQPVDAADVRARARRRGAALVLLLGRDAEAFEIGAA